MILDQNSHNSRSEESQPCDPSQSHQRNGDGETGRATQSLGGPALARQGSGQHYCLSVSRRGLSTPVGLDSRALTKENSQELRSNSVVLLGFRLAQDLLLFYSNFSLWEQEYLFYACPTFVSWKHRTYLIIQIHSQREICLRMNHALNLTHI